MKSKSPNPCESCKGKGQVVIEPIGFLPGLKGKCPVCNGSGSQPSSDTTCPACDGEGYIGDASDWTEPEDRYVAKCHTCHGTGHIETSKPAHEVWPPSGYCADCRGYAPYDDDHPSQPDKGIEPLHIPSMYSIDPSDILNIALENRAKLNQVINYINRNQRQ